MRTKLFAALLCAMCISLMGCKKDGKNDPESPQETKVNGVRYANGYAIYEVFMEDGRTMWFSRKADAEDTSKVYLTSAFAYYQKLDDAKKYTGDVVVPSSFEALGIIFTVVGLQPTYANTSYVCPFNGCKKITSITLPNTIHFIPAYAFSHLDSLTSIVLPESLDSIERYAISCCNGLTALTIPASVKKLANSCVENCEKLSTINMLPAVPPYQWRKNEESDGYLPFYDIKQNLMHIYTPVENVDVYKKTWWRYDFLIAAFGTEELPIEALKSNDNGHEYVDMGLGTCWATMNVGALREEGNGDSFAWGETAPKEIYSWDTYKYYEALSSYNGRLTKYTTPGQILDKEDDAASVNWGGDWRIPKSEEWEELITKCKWNIAKVNGISGVQIVSRVSGHTNASIFIPTQNKPVEYSSASLSPFEEDKALNAISCLINTDAPNNQLSLYYMTPRCSACFVRPVHNIVK